MWKSYSGRFIDPTKNKLAVWVCKQEGQNFSINLFVQMMFFAFKTIQTIHQGILANQMRHGKWKGLLLLLVCGRGKERFLPTLDLRMLRVAGDKVGRSQHHICRLWLKVDRTGQFFWECGLAAAESILKLFGCSLWWFDPIPVSKSWLYHMLHDPFSKANPTQPLVDLNPLDCCRWKQKTGHPTNLAVLYKRGSLHPMIPLPCSPASDLL